MPIRCFWLLSQNINRIEAQSDMRRLSVAVYSQCQSTEAVTDFRDRLVLEMGEIFTYTVDEEYINREKLDRAGLEALRAQSSNNKKN